MLARKCPLSGLRKVQPSAVYLASPYLDAGLPVCEASNSETRAASKFFHRGHILDGRKGDRFSLVEAGECRIHAVFSGHHRRWIKRMKSDAGDVPNLGGGASWHHQLNPYVSTSNLLLEAQSEEHHLCLCPAVSSAPWKDEER